MILCDNLYKNLFNLIMENVFRKARFYCNNFKLPLYAKYKNGCIKRDVTEALNVNLLRTRNRLIWQKGVSKVDKKVHPQKWKEFSCFPCCKQKWKRDQRLNCSCLIKALHIVHTSRATFWINKHKQKCRLPTICQNVSCPYINVWE